MFKSKTFFILRLKKIKFTEIVSNMFSGTVFYLFGNNCLKNLCMRTHSNEYVHMYFSSFEKSEILLIYIFIKYWNTSKRV